MNWTLLIKKVKNGYILRGKFNNDITEEFLIEEGEDELKAMQDVLYNISEYFGIISSKHKPRNLRITIDEKEIPNQKVA